MSVRLYDQVIKYIAYIETTAPLHIGSAVGDKSEVLVHPIDRKPFIQASGIAGVCRAYSAEINGNKVTNSMFGADRFHENDNATEHASILRISDGVFDADKVLMEFRPRIAIDPVTGSVQNNAKKGNGQKKGHKFEMESIGAGQKCTFAVYLFDKAYETALENIFAGMKDEMLQFGGQKSNGSGFMKLTALSKQRFELKKAEDRKRWRDDEEKIDQGIPHIDKLTVIGGRKNVPVAYTIRCLGETEGALLVKSIAVRSYGKNAPDAQNMQNSKGEYIVPGSAVKGAIRSRMAYIAGYLGKQNIIDDAFGYKGKGRDKGTAGNLIVRDVIVGEKDKNEKVPLQNRIHIDKFTGGVMHSGKFAEKNAYGNVSLEFQIKNKHHPDATCGLLMLALRDLASGLMNIGGGYNVGKGFIKAERIIIEDHRSAGKKAEILFADAEVNDPDGLINGCLEILQKEGM